jgi:hypothetical protein
MSHVRVVGRPVRGRESSDAIAPNDDGYKALPVNNLAAIDTGVALCHNTRMMTAKFHGRCTLCHGDILAGAPINWARGFGASHVAGMCSVQPIVATPPTTLGPGAAIDAYKIVAFLTAAKAHIKFPKARFLAPDGASEMRLSLAGATSRYPGAVQVKVSSLWVGRINADGTLTTGLTNYLPTLSAIAADPATAAKAYGALMGHCTFCGLQLTDAGSVEVGYGPICAGHWGLPHTPKGTPTLTTVAHV